MDKTVLAILRFSEENLVSISMEFGWFSTLITMKRDVYERSVRLTNEYIEKVNSDMVIETVLKNMLMDINKYYE